MRLNLLSYAAKLGNGSRVGVSDGLYPASSQSCMTRLVIASRAQAFSWANGGRGMQGPLQSGAFRPGIAAAPIGYNRLDFPIRPRPPRLQEAP